MEILSANRARMDGHHRIRLKLNATVPTHWTMTRCMTFGIGRLKLSLSLLPPQAPLAVPHRLTAWPPPLPPGFARPALCHFRSSVVDIIREGHALCFGTLVHCSWC